MNLHRIIGVMGYIVDEKIQDRTTCRNSFHCLSGNMEGVCEIFNAENIPIVVTDCPKKAEACHYCKPFDVVEGFCKCPTRLELYKRYGI